MLLRLVNHEVNFLVKYLITRNALHFPLDRMNRQMSNQRRLRVELPIADLALESLFPRVKFFVDAQAVRVLELLLANITGENRGHVHSLVAPKGTWEAEGRRTDVTLEGFFILMLFGVNLEILRVLEKLATFLTN